MDVGLEVSGFWRVGFEVFGSELCREKKGVGGLGFSVEC